MEFSEDESHSEEKEKSKWQANATRWQMNFMVAVDLIDVLRIALKTASLSMWKIMWLPLNLWPQQRMAYTTANISLTWMCSLHRWRGQQAANYSDPKWLPRPFALLASVKMLILLQAGEIKRILFHAGAMPCHYSRSRQATLGMCQEVNGEEDGKEAAKS